MTKSQIYLPKNVDCRENSQYEKINSDEDVDVFFGEDLGMKKYHISYPELKYFKIFLIVLKLEMENVCTTSFARFTRYSCPVAFSGKQEIRLQLQ